MTKAEYDLQKKKKYQEYKAGLITNYAYIQWKKKNDPSLNGGAASTSTTKNTATTMPDPGQEAADQAVGELEKRLRKTYKQAKDEITKKLAEWSKEYAAKDAEMQAKVATGEITQDEYQSWQQGQALAGKLWRQKLDQVSGVLLQANQQAMEIINKQKMGVFAENANYQSYQLTQDTKLDLSFAVYDVDAVTKLVKDQPELLPRKQVNGKKDKAWNQTKMANIAAQAIIQGESIPQIAKRIAAETASDNMSAMVRYARTAMTSAQNAGRMETLHRAKGMGIQCKKVWLATLDRRTRDSHRNLDGQVRDIDEPFDSDFGKIMFPGDPEGHPGDVYNCRCTLTYQYLDYPADPSTNDRLMYEEWDEEVPVKKKDKNGREYETKKIIHHRESKLVTDLTYDQWVEYKQNQIRVKDKSDEKVFIQKNAYTESEKEAIHEYTTSSYSGVNSALREGTVENYESVKRIVDEIDSAMEKTVVSEGTVASRGASMADLRGMFEDKRRSWFEDPDNLKSLEGQTATFKSYISATKGESVAEPYKRELQWHFTTEGEVHGIDAEQFASSSVKLEREIIFDRDARIEIEKVKVNVDSDGDIIGVVEIWAKIKEDTKKGKNNINSQTDTAESRLQQKINQALKTNKAAQGQKKKEGKK